MTAKKDPRYVSLRIPHEVAEMIAQESGLDRLPISTWIIQVAGAEAARRQGKPEPVLKRQSVPPPSGEITKAVSAVSGFENLTLDTLIAALHHVVENGKVERPTQPPPAHSSGTRPAIRPTLRPGEYSLQRSITPAQLNRAIRAAK